MIEYQNALNNLKAMIRAYGADAYTKDIEVLENFIQSKSLSARQKAMRILSDFELYGEFYYELEDWLVDQLMGHFYELPDHVNGEYLKSAIRVELKNLSENIDSGLVDLTNEDIENVVDRLFSTKATESVLNQDFIEDTFYRYVTERINLSFDFEEED